MAEYRPDERIVLHGVSNGMPWTSEMTFAPIDEGTMLSESIQLQPAGVARFFSPVMALLVRRTHRRDLAGLRFRLESVA
jgi:hypothetical protein